MVEVDDLAASIRVERVLDDRCVVLFTATSAPSPPSNTRISYRRAITLGAERLDRDNLRDVIAGVLRAGAAEHVASAVEEGPVLGGGGLGGLHKGPSGAGALIDVTLDPVCKDVRLCSLGRMVGGTYERRSWRQSSRGGRPCRQ